MSNKKRTVEVVLTVEIPKSEDTTNETVATFFNWEICHRVSEETEGENKVMVASNMQRETALQIINSLQGALEVVDGK